MTAGIRQSISVVAVFRTCILVSSGLSKVSTLLNVFESLYHLEEKSG